ncbi:MAG: GHKL domain-containing protein, partial [Chloroflexi bacterium]|nr:GHKL domain-containing protein [Chloroflexota bacterium]
YLWTGPHDLSTTLRLEWRFVAVRWLGIVMVGPGLQLTGLPADRLRAAYVVLVVAAIYNLLIQWLMPRHPRLFASGYLTTMGDTVLNIAMVTVGGGFNSPFYFLLFTVAISAAMRYGYGPALLMALIFTGFDTFEHFEAGLTIDAPIVFRSGFLTLTAVLAGYLREQAYRAEMALQERLRQANLLNEATAALGASLELERVLDAVIVAASHLFDGASVVLQPSAGLDDVQSLGPLMHNLDVSRPGLRDELLEIAGRFTGTAALKARDGQAFRREQLPAGQQAMVVVIAVPTRQTSLATLAVATPQGRPLPKLDDDILSSFAERVTLALENSSLYRRLASRSTDLQRAYADLASAHQELVRVDEMKTNFLANVSHEFRTPLTSIRSFSELLLSYQEDTDVQREFVGIINAESERLTRMVNDVLDITKIESGTMDWQMTVLNIGDLLHEAARAHAPLIEKQNLAFREDVATGLPPVYADKDRLQQVIANLLNNALKFTPRGSIELSARKNKGEILISVADTGIGVAAEDQERIFDKFQQVGAMLTDKPRGTGLGLSICREIIEHHEGRIWIESEPGRGSKFNFALPVAKNAPAETTSKPAADRSPVMA